MGVHTEAAQAASLVQSLSFAQVVGQLTDVPSHTKVPQLPEPWARGRHEPVAHDPQVPQGQPVQTCVARLQVRAAGTVQSPLLAQPTQVPLRQTGVAPPQSLGPEQPVHEPA